MLKIADITFVIFSTCCLLGLCSFFLSNSLSRSQETILVFLFKRFIIYLKLLKTLRSRTLFIVADYIILISETLFLYNPKHFFVFFFVLFDVDIYIFFIFCLSLIGGEKKIKTSSKVSLEHITNT